MILDPFQAEGAAFLAERTVALLADEPGLGKTVQAIYAVNALMDGALSVHIVCPASAVPVWRAHISECSKPRIVWRVESYDMAAKWGGSSLPIDVLILDEAHYLKSKQAKRTRAIYGPKCNRMGGLAEHADRVFLLTGTPEPNNPSELWTHFHAIFPGAIPSRRRRHPMCRVEFTERYCNIWTDKNGHPHIAGGQNLGELRGRLAPHVLRRKFDDVKKDLPPIRFSLLPLAVSATDVRRIARETEGFDHDGPSPPSSTLRRYTGVAKIEPMIEWVRDWFDGGGGKLVLFAHHHEVIERLVDAFAMHAVKLMGGASMNLRTEAVELFQNDAGCRLFIGQLQAAGTAISLTAAHTLVLVESSWVPGENEQAAMRIRRIGQKNACQVYFAHAAGTIDEKIQAANLRKIETIKQTFA